jgi:hypothetical protein
MDLELVSQLDTIQRVTKLENLSLKGPSGPFFMRHFGCYCLFQKGLSANFSIFWPWCFSCAFGFKQNNGFYDLFAV